MNHFPLLPIFVGATAVVVLAILALLATRSWWALGGALAVLLAMSAVVGNELREILKH
jgi:hypothetical protein